MSNYPHAPPVWGPIRGRGGYNTSFSPYPAARGRGRGVPGFRGRGRGAAHGFGNVHLVNSNDAFTESPDVVMTPDTSSSPRTRNVFRSTYPAHPPPPPSAPAREMRINDVIFNLDADGSKLTRITPQGEGPLTPEETMVAGVKFYRTKHGNLYREDRYKQLIEKKRLKPKKLAELCPKFNNTGQCTRDCKFTHDINKVAVCKQLLMKGTCPAGSGCPLSHDLTANRTPACIHFVRGSCTKPDCRYPHVKVSLDAPVCSPFARLGYCEKGADCPNQHVFECPDYANTGRCSNKKCRLQHIDRAGQLRRIAGVQNVPAPTVESPSTSNSSDKDDEADEDSDVDIEDAKDGEIIRPLDADDQSTLGVSAFSQQDDYVRL